MIKLLCFSDIHGNMDAVAAMFKDLRCRGAVYDAAIFAGDFTNLLLDSDVKHSQRCYDEVVEQACGICHSLFYVFGNRDEPRNSIRTNKNGFLLEQGKKYPIDDTLWITTTPELIDDNTIYVEHNPFLADAQRNRPSHTGDSPRVDSYRVYEKAFLHMAGHTHKGLFIGNYLNTGFVYLDDAHGDVPTAGGYCEVLIEGPEIQARFRSIGPLVEKSINLNGYSGKQFTTRDMEFLRLEYF